MSWYRRIRSSCTRAKTRGSGESGQVLVLLAVGMVALVALAGFAVDVSAAYQTHRRTQAAADAAAMAAAEYLPESTSQASAASSTVSSQNLSDGTVTLAYSSTYTSNDTVTSTAKATSNAAFTKVIGINSFTATATATVTVGSYTAWANNIAPWITDKTDIQWGQTITFKTDQAGQGNFGAVNLPIQEGGCNLGTGGNDYRFLINNTDHSCLVAVGNTLQSKTGNLAGPTQQGLDERTVNGQHVGNPFDPYSLLQTLADGTYELTTFNHPNLIVIPVTDTIGNGKASFNVIGFAWFIITSYTSKKVSGMFIGSAAPKGATCPTATNSNAICPVGAYNQYGFKVVTLSQ
jgi:Flp pilus assembly protein TadG